LDALVDEEILGLEQDLDQSLMYLYDHCNGSNVIQQASEPVPAQESKCFNPPVS